jgi:hypothetical protein
MPGVKPKIVYLALCILRLVLPYGGLFLGFFNTG